MMLPLLAAYVLRNAFVAVLMEGMHSAAAQQRRWVRRDAGDFQARASALQGSPVCWRRRTV